MGLDVTQNSSVNTYTENKSQSTKPLFSGNTENNSDVPAGKLLDLRLPDLNNDTYSFHQVPEAKLLKDITFVDNTPTLRITDAKATGSTLEVGSTEKTYFKMKVTKDFPNAKPDVSFDSPFIKDYARDKAEVYIKDPLKKSIYEPIKENMGKTVADTAVTAVTFATVMAVSRHLHSGNAKLNLPTDSIMNKNFKTGLIVGYGDGNHPKINGFDIRNKFFVNNELLTGKNVEFKAIFEKKEIMEKKDVIERGLELNINEAYNKTNPSYVGMYLKNNDVTGKTLGVTYELGF